ncbi:MAG: hypothetical protein ABID84_06085, partial [Chloroflexota bacterium]
PTVTQNRERTTKEQGEPAYPVWFLPVTALPGYRKINRTKLVDVIEVACKSKRVAPSKVVAAFCEYWPVGQVRHGWTEPGAALHRTLDVQIDKAKQQTRRVDDPNVSQAFKFVQAPDDF